MHLLASNQRNVTRFKPVMLALYVINSRTGTQKQQLVKKILKLSKKQFIKKLNTQFQKVQKLLTMLQIRLLQSRISQLGLFDRAIILLWLENMSYDEIGTIVGISAKNVSVRLVRIKEQLKKMSNQ